MLKYIVVSLIMGLITFSPSTKADVNEALPKKTLEPFNYTDKLTAEGVSILLSRIN